MANEKRLIDAKALEKQIKQAFEDTNPYAMGIMLRWIRKQTKVDAVEVVRCRDCRWCELFKDINSYCHHPTDGMHYVQQDDFCSYGERKDDD